VRPRDAFPGASFSSSAPLGAVVFIERFNAAHTVLEETERDWMASRMVGNFHAGLSRHSREVVTALGATNLVPLDRAFAEKTALVARALEGRPTYLLQVPRSLPADEASDVIVDHLHRVLERAGLA
jgi:hypothetical protein